MKNKINIAELLRDCPQGMELDCTMYDNITFYGINEGNAFPINIKRKDGVVYILTKYGQVNNDEYAKCIIFPKGKTTWEGFAPFCKFKNGDIVITTLGNIAIISNKLDNKIYNTYCELFQYGTFTINDTKVCPERFATEEEKQILFNAIKENGYCWHAKTKTLEKLIEPKFKVGDRIRMKNSPNNISTVTKTNEDGSISVNNYSWVIKYELQGKYELVPNKFDITTLKPFDSRVLVRDTDHYEWEGAVFGRYDGNTFFTIGGIDWRFCIPYEGNEHLFGTTNDCDDFYKTWEK